MRLSSGGDKLIELSGRPDYNTTRGN